MGGKIVTEIVDTIGSFLTGVGSSIADFFQSSFTSGTGETTAITAFGTFCLVFIGIGMAMGFVHLVLAKIG